MYQNNVPQANGEAKSSVGIGKKILKQSNPLVALMSYSPCQLMLEREIQTLIHPTGLDDKATLTRL